MYLLNFTHCQQVAKYQTRKYPIILLFYCRFIQYAKRYPLGQNIIRLQPSKLITQLSIVSLIYFYLKILKTLQAIAPSWRPRAADRRKGMLQSPVALSEGVPQGDTALHISFRTTGAAPKGQIVVFDRAWRLSPAKLSDELRSSDAKRLRPATHWLAIQDIATFFIHSNSTI